MLSQYCPIEMAAEIVAERWNLLIIRDLVGAGRGFNDLHRCLPRISRSMLADRLRRLERAGIVAAQSASLSRVGTGRNKGSCVVAPREAARSVSTLLERDGEIAMLADRYRQAVDGRDGVVLLSGEAVIGKTSLVEQFAESVRGGPSPPAFQVGRCDDLLAPSPWALSTIWRCRRPKTCRAWLFAGAMLRSVQPSKGIGGRCGMKAQTNVKAGPMRSH